MRPGSAEGLREQKHWGWENSALKNGQKDFLRQEIRRRFADNPRKQAELMAWVSARNTTVAKAARVCKLWGVELPSSSYGEGRE